MKRKKNKEMHRYFEYENDLGATVAVECTPNNRMIAINVISEHRIKSETKYKNKKGLKLSWY